jgi:hypothetical protein
MRLAYLTHKLDSTDPKLLSLFDDINIFHSDPDFQEARVPELEESLKREGFNPYCSNDFFLYTRDLRTLGMALSRNRFNSGMKSKDGELILGNTQIKLNHAIKLPFDDKSRILAVSPHHDEEYCINLAINHRIAGNDVHILIVTDQQEGAKNSTQEIYQQSLGLGEDNFSFIGGIKDRHAHTKESKNRIMCGLDSAMDRFDPNVVILPPDDGNGDHMSVLRTSLSDLDQYKGDILLGGTSQVNYDGDTRLTPENLKYINPEEIPDGDIRFTPKLFDVFSGSELKKILGLYSDGNFGFQNYIEMTRIISHYMPQSLLRYCGGKGLKAGQDIAGFEYSPIRVSGAFSPAVNFDL